MPKNGDTVFLVSVLDENDDILGYHVEASEDSASTLVEQIFDQAEEVSSCTVIPIIIGYTSEEFNATIH